MVTILCYSSSVILYERTALAFCLICKSKVSAVNEFTSEFSTRRYAYSRGWSRTGSWGCLLHIPQRCELWSAAGRQCWASNCSESRYNPEHGGWCSWSPAPPAGRTKERHMQIKRLNICQNDKKITISSRSEQLLNITYIYGAARASCASTHTLQSDELCPSYFMTSLLLISTDKATGGFTHRVCIWHIASRCGGRKRREGSGSMQKRKDRNEPLWFCLCAVTFSQLGK